MIKIEIVPREERFRALRPPWSRPNRLEQFVGLPRRLPPDRLRTPLLDLEQADLLDRRSHPFYQPDSSGPGAEAELFLARRDGEVVGRVAAIVNHQHNRFESARVGRAVRVGNFGFYEAVPEQAVADALLESAAQWLRGQGMTEMVGPASPAHNYYYGSRVTAEEPGPLTPSRFLEVYNPSYYNDQYRAWGLEVVHTLYGYDADLEAARIKQVTARFERAIQELIATTGITIRRCDMGDFDQEITRAVELINRSLADNWGYSPMTRAELAYMARQMRWLIDPDLVLFVELDGEPVGISLAMPDYNELFAAMDGRLSRWPAALRFGNLPLVRWLWPDGNAWATRRFEYARVIALGVVPTVWRGASAVRRELLRLGPALVYATLINLRQAGYRHVTASWILEENRAMQAPFHLVGLEPTRTWKIYGRGL